MSNTPQLLKAGQIARKAGVLASTIRFYTKEGLLSFKSRTPGGYYLYEAHQTLQTIQYIHQLKQKRFTLEEIKQQMRLKTMCDSLQN